MGLGPQPLGKTTRGWGRVPHSRQESDPASPRLWTLPTDVPNSSPPSPASPVCAPTHVWELLELAHVMDRSRSPSPCPCPCLEPAAMPPSLQATPSPSRWALSLTGAGSCRGASACSRSDAPCFVHCSLLADGVEADHRPRWAGPAAESRPLCPGAQSEPAPSRRLLVFARAGALGSSPDASSLPWDVRQYPDLWAPAGRRTPLWTDQGGVRTCCHLVAERWQHVPSARWKGTVRASVPGTTRS